MVNEVIGNHPRRTGLLALLTAAALLALAPVVHADAPAGEQKKTQKARKAPPAAEKPADTTTSAAPAETPMPAETETPAAPVATETTEAPAEATLSTEQAGRTTPLPGTVTATTMTTNNTRDHWWEFSGGWEADTHDTGYAFAGPSYHHRLSDDVSLNAGIHATNLEYAFENGVGGETEVHAPGFSPNVGLRFGRKNWIQGSAGLEVRRYRTEITDATDLMVSDDKDTRVGMSLGASAWLVPSSRSNVHAMIHYGTASKYTWGRLAARHQISNFSWHGPVTLYAGAEGIGQGNEDIRSWMAGGLLEFLIHRTSLSIMGRAGYKHSSFDIGPDKTGPYFGIGLWKRF